jgi:hypothetical protein
MLILAAPNAFAAHMLLLLLLLLLLSLLQCSTATSCRRQAC